MLAEPMLSMPAQQSKDWVPPYRVHGEPVQHRWGPYADNGGTILAVAGKDYACLLSDTRLSTGFSIYTRENSKVTQLTPHVCLASAGMQAERETLHRVLKMRMLDYEHEHRKPPSLEAVAQLLSTMLYYKRFFPYYTFNVLAGVDSKGVGGVYVYDAIGSFERVPYACNGSGGHQSMSVLDNQVAKTNQLIPGEPLDKVGVINVMKDAITSVGERDIYTGDQAEVFVIDAAGVDRTLMDLKAD
jgi:20S proteasome subunit beta 6